MYKSPDGWSQYTETWSVKTLQNMMKRKVLQFSWDKQRGYVWGKAKASLFIHSIFWGMLENTETFRFTKHDNMYLCTDGQQRGLTIMKYINNEFSLSGLKNSYPIYLSDGSIEPVNNKFFKQLSDELKEKILDLQINIAILENASPDVEGEMFARMNNGQSVTKTDIAISRNENSKAIEELGQHELFSVMFQTKGVEAKRYRPVIIKSWVALTQTEPNYKSAYLHKLEETLALSNEDTEDLNALFNSLVEIYKHINVMQDTTKKKMFENSILYYYIPYLDMFNGDYKLTAQWLNSFCSNITEEYRQPQGFSDDIATTVHRMNIIKKSIEDFLSNGSSEEQLTF